MNKFHFNIRINIKDNNAGSKATLDCRTILIKNGFRDMELAFIKVWYLMPLNFLKLFFTLIRYFVSISPGSFIVVQYPLLGINKYFKYYIRLLKIKRCKFCCIIHDLDSLRPEHDQWSIAQELDALSHYDAVVSHNSSMTSWLRANGYRGHIEEIFLFDYLSAQNRLKVFDRERSGTIAFAGSLSRGTFLKKLAQNNHSFDLNLYGPGFRESLIGNNSRIKWYGSFSPDEIIDQVTGDFGLVWDGDSLEEISGVMGNYVRFNSPHKTSLYLAAGIPVIVAKNAALADFVVKNNLGICVNSLHEINSSTCALDNDFYQEMRYKAFQIGEKLRDGQFLQNAIKKTEDYLYNK